MSNAFRLLTDRAGYLKHRCVGSMSGLRHSIHRWQAAPLLLESLECPNPLRSYKVVNSKSGFGLPVLSDQKWTLEIKGITIFVYSSIVSDEIHTKVTLPSPRSVIWIKTLTLCTKFYSIHLSLSYFDWNNPVHQKQVVFNFLTNYFIFASCLDLMSMPISTNPSLSSELRITDFSNRLSSFHNHFGVV